MKYQYFFRNYLKPEPLKLPYSSKNRRKMLYSKTIYRLQHKGFRAFMTLINMLRVNLESSL